MKKLLKRIICLAVASACIFSNLTTLAAEKDISVYEYQSFEEYITNGEQNYFTAEGIADAIVVEDGVRNKALMINKKELYGSDIKKTFDAVTGDVVLQFDIKIEGEIFPWNLTLKSSNGKTIVPLNDDGKGNVLSPEGKTYGNIGRNKWVNVAVVFSPAAKRFSVLINKKVVLKDWILQNSTFDKLTEMRLSMKPIEKGDSKVYIDNFKVYSGKKLANDSIFQKGKYNENSVNYTEKEIKESTSIVKSDNFDDTVGKLQAKLNTVEVREEAGNKYLHIEESGTGDCFFEYFNGIGTEYYTVYSVDVRSPKYSGSIQLFQFKLDPDNVVCQTVKIVAGGSLQLYDGTKLAQLQNDKWYNITLSVNFITKKYNVYLDGNMVAENVKMQSEGGFPTNMRFYCSGGRSNIINLDNILVYYGKEPRQIYDESTVSGFPIKTTLSYWDVDEEPEKILKDKLAYNAIVSSVYENNQKITDNETGAFLDGEVIYLPVEKTAERLGKSVSKASGSIKYGDLTLNVGSDILEGSKQVKLSAKVKEKNGVIYAPADAFGKDKMLGEPIFYNQRGFAMFGVDTLATEEESHATRYMHFERPSAGEILDKYSKSELKNQHPRVLLTTEDFNTIKNNIATDETASEMFKKVKNAYMNAEEMPTMVYQLVNGDRLLPTSEEILARVMGMSFIYQITGETSYAERAYKELEAAANFPTWHPVHFLDTAKLCQAFAVGYDWLYNYLTEERREVVEKALVKFGMREYLIRYTTREWWADDENNWAGICNAGSVMTALSLMDKYPEEGAAMLEIAIKGIEYCLYSFGPDGACYEGPSYWNANIENIGLIFQTLKSVLNEDYSLSSSAGFDRTLDWAASIAYKDLGFNTGDAGDKGTITFRDSMWLGNYYERPEFQAKRHEALAKGITGGGIQWAIYDIMYYKPEYMNGAAKKIELDNKFRQVEMASTRSSWKDDAMFLAYKGGSSIDEGHTHMDSGTFSIFQDGICWAQDYGYDNYNAQGYYEFGDNANPNRWDFYRVNTQGHNAVVINPAEDVNAQDWKVLAKITRFESKEKGSIGVVDLTETYAHKAKKYIRGYMLTDDRRSAVIRDEMNLKGNNNEVYWFMHTGITGEENFEIKDNSVMITHPSGEKLYLEFTTNAKSAEIFTMNSEFLDTYPTPAKDMWAVEGRKVAIRLTGGGDVNLTVKMYDGDLVGSVPSVKDTPINKWTIEDGELKNAPVLTGIYKDGVLAEEFNENKTEYELTIYHDLDYPEITATAEEGAHVEVTHNEEKTEYKFKVVSDSDPSFFSNYTVKMRKVPYIYETLRNDFTKIEPVKITASRVPEVQNPPENVNDGSFASRFAVDGDNEWIELDYGSVVDADGFAVSYYKGTERISYYDVLISEDGVNYTTVFEGETSGISDYYEMYKTGKLRLRYLKLVGHMSSAGSWNSPTEIALVVRKGE